MGSGAMGSAISVSPVKFTGWSGESIHIKHAVRGEDLVIHVMPRRRFPKFAEERTVRALIELLGEAAMSRVVVELVDNKIVEEGTSVSVRCMGMGTDVHESILFPKFHQLLDGYMQAP